LTGFRTGSSGAAWRIVPSGESVGWQTRRRAVGVGPRSGPRNSATAALGAASTKPAGGTTLEATPSGAKLSCLLRGGDSFPGRRTSLCRHDRPRGRERAGGRCAGCQAELRDGRCPDCRGSSGSECRQTICLKIRGQFDGVVQPGTVCRRAATARPLASLNSNCVRNNYFFWFKYGSRIAIAKSAFVPQRFPTVRRVIHLGNCE